MYTPAGRISASNRNKKYKKKILIKNINAKQATS